jgi:hypothetical protein
MNQTPTDPADSTSAIRTGPIKTVFAESGPQGLPFVCICEEVHEFPTSVEGTQRGDSLEIVRLILVIIINPADPYSL